MGLRPYNLEIEKGDLSKAEVEINKACKTSPKYLKPLLIKVSFIDVHLNLHEKAKALFCEIETMIKGDKRISNQDLSLFEFTRALLLIGDGLMEEARNSVVKSLEFDYNLERAEYLNILESKMTTEK